MKFRTEVTIENSIRKIGIEDHIFSIGSCFSTEISDLLRTGQLQTLNNPFGTIFNPYSVNKAIQKLHDSQFYQEDDLIAYHDEVLSLDHHTSFNSRFAHQTLEKINAQIEIGNLFLQHTDWVLITYGSSFIYEFLPKKKFVANCHKIPAKYFEKQLLSQDDIKTALRQTILNLNDIGKKDVQLLFTVSPVRHTKDGMAENQLSKAKLITAIHEVLPAFENCHYLPVYEILMDDLRDYRFYKEDMVHPNSQALSYIFEQFGNAFFSDETMDFIEENFKINKALEHRSRDENHPKYQEFLQKVNERITIQQKKVNHKIFPVT